jgi:DNA-binding transcriptional LysR family regulator
VLPYARAALDAVTQIQQTVDELAGLLRGQVAIGMVVQCASLDLPEILAGFRSRYPGIDVTLAEDNTDRLVEGVRDGRYDLVFLGLGPDDPEGLELRIVADEPIVAVVGPDDPLAGEPSVPLSAIADRAVIALPSGTGMRACVDAGYAALNLRPRVALEATNPAMLARLAARGLGLAFVTTSTARAHGTGLHRVEITDPAMRARLAIAWRKNGPLSPAARAMIDHARGTTETGPVRA